VSLYLFIRLCKQTDVCADPFVLKCMLYVNKPLCYTIGAICFFFHKSLDVHGDILGYEILHEGDIFVV
jgi:hypothetical protein